MSLISLENILEPLTNKVHLITIILVVFLVALFRLQTGGFSIQTNVQPVKLHKPNTATTSTAAPAPQAPRAAAVAPAAPQNPAQQQLLDKILDESANEAKRNEQEEAARNAPPAPDSALDDIERSLGIR